METIDSGNLQISLFVFLFVSDSQILLFWLSAKEKQDVKSD